MGFALIQAVGVGFAFIALVVVIILVAWILFSAIKVV